MVLQEEINDFAIGYRIVDVKNGKVLSLFHGTQKSREIKLDQWNVADIKKVRDGSGDNWYYSGWHFLWGKSVCERFFEKTFKNKENRKVVKCLVCGNLRPKHPKNPNSIFLADKIFISSVDVF